ncbi:MAG: alpha/beta hydrolase family protein [Pirellulales bacterium]
MAYFVRIGCCIATALLALPLHVVGSDDVAPKKQCSATTPTELATWQTDNRQLLYDLLKLADLEKQRDESPTGIPFNVKVLKSEDRQGYTRQEIEFDSTPTRRIKAIVTIPAGATGPAPAVVCIHGHGGSRNIVYDKSSLYQGFANELATRGYVTISTDVGQHEVYEQGRSLMGERLWDVLRCADYVSSLKEVDAQRMGCAGLSLGGEMAMWLGAMDPRMKVTVSSGFLTTVKNLQNGHCMCWDFPGFTENFDFCDIYSLIAPRALLCQIGAKETAPGGFPPALAYDAMANIQRAYAVGSFGHRARLDVHPAGHVFETIGGCKFIDDVLRPATNATGG